MAEKIPKPNSDMMHMELVSKFEFVDIELLKPYERNAKIHTKKKLAKLKHSITKSKVVTTIVVRSIPNSKYLEIIGGHARVEALKELGYKKAPVVMADHLNDAQAKALRLADNFIADDAEYDFGLIKIELEELTLSDEIVITDTGLDIAQIDELIIEGYGEKKKKEKPDKADEIGNSSQIEERVKVGDIWEMGNHLLFCGDALKAKSYERLLNGEKARLVLVDAPYNVKIDGHVCGKGKTKHQEFAMASGEMSDNEYGTFTGTFMTRLVENSVNGSLHYLFIDWRGAQIFLNAGSKHYKELKNLIVWDKKVGGMGSMYRSQHELICLFKSGTAPHINNVELGKNGRYRTNVWNHRGVSATNPKSLELLKLHPTTKSVGLLHEILLDASCAGDLVLDCFCGSGSVLLSCERAKRRARVIEIDPHYCDVVLYRWEHMTGKKAELLTNIGGD